MKLKIILQERDRDIIVMGVIAIISLITTAITFWEFRGIYFLW